MAVITLQIPDQHLPRVIEALCVAGDYTEDQGPRPAFAKAQIVRWLRDTTLGVERAQRRRDALINMPEPEDLDLNAE